MSFLKSHILNYIFIFTFILVAFTVDVKAQEHNADIQQKDVTYIIKTLAADSMMGRRTFTPGIQKAAHFIVKKFEEIGLEKKQGLDSYRQRFEMIKSIPEEIDVRVDGQTISSKQAMALSTQKNISWTEASNIKIDTIGAEDSFIAMLRNYMEAEQNTLVWVDKTLSAPFKRIKSFFEEQTSFPDSVSVVFILSDPASNFEIAIKNKQAVKKTANIVGVLPGDTFPNEFVVFSAHYDHLGVADEPVNGDRIYNGANDDASGTTAVIELAKYFKARNDNKRTIIFVTFTGEELGGYGSRYFSQQLDPDKVIAMFNIEMIGTRSKWGKNSAYITGFDKSSFGKILQQNLKESEFTFHPDPYPKQNLFYRSDNATLARLGVPAHTISTAKMQNEPNYHKLTDEVSTLDLENMKQIIHAIAESSQSIISGEDTPTRVEPQSLRQ